MKPCPTLRLLALLCAVASSLAAQTPAAPDPATLTKYDKNHNGKIDPEELTAMQADDQAIELSTFVVRTDQDRGYQAADAGSGGRVDMPFKLVPAAMSAMTKEFLEDWNVTDMRESFKYAMNVDVANNSAPNTSPFGDFQFNFRGVGDSGNYPTRNYFLYYGNSDAYNTERFEFARGPNSVLFGDGQIGGIATTMTKQPRLGRDAYEATARIDSWGGLRLTFDGNKVISGKQAARVNAVYNRNNYGSAWRDNARLDERGIDIAWAYKFNAKTTLRTEAEWMRTLRMVYTTTYGDNLGYYTPGTVYDGTAFTGAQQTALGVTPVSTNAQNWTYIPAEPNLGLVNTGGSAQYRSTGPGFAIQPEGRSDLPGITSPAKLPNREFNLGPNDTWSRYKYQVYSFYLDHRFSDTVSGQLSFYDYNNDRNTREGSFAGSLQYDINKFLPGTTTPNPKLGVLYGEMTPNRSYQENYVYEWRGLVTWKPRLPFNGRAQFSGIIGNRSERFEARGLSPARMDGPNQVWTAAENTLRYRYYADEPNKYGFGYDLPPDKPGFTYRWIQTGFASVEHKDIQYLQAVAAGSFLDDRLSLLGGVRNDDLTDDQYGNIGGFNDAHGLQAYGGFIPGVGTRPGAHNLTKAGAFTYNYGGTAWIDKKKMFGVFYNWSKNFAPPTSGAAKIIGFNPDGTFIGGAFGATTGHSKEYGVRFSFLDGMISAEARKYDSLQIDRIDGGVPLGSTTADGIIRAWANSGPTYANNSTLTTMSWRDVGALTAEGYEYQITANVKGLRLQANYSLPKTASADVRPGTLAYVNNFIPIWQKWASAGMNDKGEALLPAEIQNINSSILNIQNNVAGSAPGTVNNGTNKWTGSLAATYQFARESALKGFSIGWGINGRGERKTGSIPPAILYNLPPNVPATPQQNRDAAFAYFYAPSYYTQDMNMAYRRKFGKYNWRFQLNVSNLTDVKDLIFNNYQTYRVKGDANNPLSGLYPTSYTWLDPRKISLTTAVAF